MNLGLHIAGLFVLALSIAFSAFSSVLMQMSPELRGWGMFQFANSLVLLAIVGARLWQVSLQRLALSPRSRVELAAVNIGAILIVVGIPGTLLGRLFSQFSGVGSSSYEILLAYGGSSVLIVGLALFELVIANQRDPAAPRVAKPPGSGGKAGIAALSMFGIGLLVGAAIAGFFALVGASL